MNPNWWAEAVNPTLKKQAQNRRLQYAAKPKNALPGTHDIYLIFLRDLTEIIRANSHLFIPVIPTIDEWIVTLEEIRVPRNLVGHMNFPNAFDRIAIDRTYSQLPSLLRHVAAYPVSISIPK